ncbi:Tn3 family transposase [Carnobacterium maltaromaticum]|uniref:Tn3 family transposase n=1 Tax=Carnobacterium maltaromaticum TaxID=2751 RepID=UPI0012F7761A|nr:Tn3 family transposase [Carnobacterium maltaromaticum]
MASIEETAYPRFKSVYSENELIRTYSIPEEEMSFITRTSKKAVNQIMFAIQLKCAQRIGYFCIFEDIPESIVSFIIQQFNVQIDLKKLHECSLGRTAKRYQLTIKDYLEIKTFDDEASTIVNSTMKQSAGVKDDPADLINDGIEILIKNNYMLPSFQRLNQMAKQIRSASYLDSYLKIDEHLSSNDKILIERLFLVDNESIFSLWNNLRNDARKASLSHLKELLDLKEKLTSYQFDIDVEKLLHYSKLEQMALEAATCNAAQMKEIKTVKRNALTVVYLKKVLIRCQDDLADMIIKRISSIHKKGKQKLATHREQTQLQTDSLIQNFHHILETYHNNDPQQGLLVVEDILKAHGPDYLQQCEDYLRYGNDNYFPFLLPIYRVHRSTLFKVLNELNLSATTSDTNMTEALKLLKALRNKKSEFLDTDILILDWLPLKWKKWLQSQEKPNLICRRHFEIAIFTFIAQELKTGDLCVEGSEKYADYRTQLVSWDEFYQDKIIFCEQLSLPDSPFTFIDQLQQTFFTIADETDQNIPNNTEITLTKDSISLKKLKGKQPSTELVTIERYLQQTLKERSILDILMDTLLWLKWDRHFGPVSKHDTKIDNPLKNYLATTFCYGTNLGTSQTARSLGDMNRKQLAWTNTKHITIDSLEKAIHLVINAYNRFSLPKYWGNGTSASADGMKWNIYEQNLLSEYHIRYGGYGGIGYYHVSDMYIALFSNFIPCGVWEGVYILDLLMKQEQVDIEPKMIHADTQGQSEPIFGLAHLLGIELMPRIRNLSELKFYHPDKTHTFSNIETLLSEEINWDLISTHYDDMLRVVMSVKAGKICPSTILNSYSKKNKLYKAFRELGRVIRTQFLLRYISSSNLRQFIQGATNKNESFNNFTQWSFFGGDSTIQENNREAQKKIIKYNHLVSNCIIFYNVFVISQALERYTKETGTAISEDVVKELSPYITSHINRFGKYEIDLNRKPTQLNYELFI